MEVWNFDDFLNAKNSVIFFYNVWKQNTRILNLSMVHVIWRSILPVDEQRLLHLQLVM